MISRRPATDDDVAFAQRTHHSAYREVVERQFGEWNDAQQDAFFAADWSSATFEIILAGNEPVGYCAIEHRADDIHVRELVIDADSQGRGIGSGIIRELQQEAARTGKPIRLGTLTENRALALYTRLGFEPIGRTETHVLLEWTPRPQTESSASSEDRRAIDALRDAWVAAVAAGNAVALRDLVTSDYEVWTHGAPTLTGPDTVVAMMGAALAKYAITQSYEPIETIVSGDWAFQRGIERIRATPRDGGAFQEVAQRGLLILRRCEDGRWRYARGMTNGLPPASSGFPDLVETTITHRTRQKGNDNDAESAEYSDGR